MKTDIASLRALLDYNVVELKYVRRRPRAGSPPTRRMLCTNSQEFLMSMLGASVFHYTPPTRPPKYNAAAHTLVVTYDLFKQDFRSISAESVDVITLLPVDTEENTQQFWKYFKDNIEPMTVEEKMRFMNS